MDGIDWYWMIIHICESIVKSVDNTIQYNDWYWIKIDHCFKNTKENRGEMVIKSNETK